MGDRVERSYPQVIEYVAPLVYPTASLPLSEGQKGKFGEAARVCDKESVAEAKTRVRCKSICGSISEACHVVFMISTHLKRVTE